MTCSLAIRSKDLKISLPAIVIFVFASVSHAASFDCAKASTLVEKAICSEPQLSDLDDLLMLTYKQALIAATDTNALKTQQRLWLVNVRNKCQDSACIMLVYNERLTALKSMTSSNALITDDDQATDSVANGEIVPLCYQGLCLKDTIKKLTYPASEIKNNPNKENLSHEVLELAECIYVGKKNEIELLAKEGFTSNEAIVRSQETLEALKNLVTICGIPPELVTLKVKAKNGKDITLVYMPMTADDGTSTYMLSSIHIPYPEVHNISEMRDVALQASEVMNVKLMCSPLGTDLACSDESDTQEFWFHSGRLTIMIARNIGNLKYFDLDKTRQNPQCKCKVSF